MNLELKNKTALVCGASQGIGEATAKALAEMDANLILLARSEDKLQKVLSELKNPEKHRYLALDLMDRSRLSELLGEVTKDLGPIEILVCNSGGPAAGPLTEANERAFLDGFEGHILANSALVNCALPGMIEKGYGRIINIISTSVKIPIKNLGVSNTIRGAVASWAKSLSNELAHHGITVNNVLPGYTETPRLEKLISAAASRMNKTEEDVVKTWKQNVPMQRFAKASEVANAVAFLASPSASYINGVNLPVDGGRTGSL